MAERDYDRNPLVVELTVQVYVYGPIQNQQQLINHLQNNEDVQEQLLMLVGDNVDEMCGLDDVKLTIS